MCFGNVFWEAHKVVWHIAFGKTCLRNCVWEECIGEKRVPKGVVERCVGAPNKYFRDVRATVVWELLGSTEVCWNSVHN